MTKRDQPNLNQTRLAEPSKSQRVHSTISLSCSLSFAAIFALVLSGCADRSAPASDSKSTSSATPPSPAVPVATSTAEAPAERGVQGGLPTASTPSANDDAKRLQALEQQLKSAKTDADRKAIQSQIDSVTKQQRIPGKSPKRCVPGDPLCTDSDTPAPPGGAAPQPEEKGVIAPQ